MYLVLVIGENKFGANNVDDWSAGFGNSDLEKFVITASYLNTDGHSQEKMIHFLRQLTRLLLKLQTWKERTKD